MNIFTKEIEAFSFLKIPMVLLEDENFKILTSDAKILYSIMLQKKQKPFIQRITG